MIGRRKPLPTRVTVTIDGLTTEQAELLCTLGMREFAGADERGRWSNANLAKAVRVGAVVAVKRFLVGWGK